MAYCSYCGKEIADDARFCRSCGRQVSTDISLPNSKPERFAERKEEYAGTIVKCPSCGEVLPSFTAICPACGHELSTSGVSTTLSDFTEQIKKADLRIAMSPQTTMKNGWDTWTDGKKLLWIIINILTVGIPALAKNLKPYSGIEKSPVLSPEESRKVVLINSYNLPNERETILEVLLFIKAQTTILAPQKTKEAYQWISIWYNKASQIFQKAQILLPGDTIALNAYKSIQQDKQRTKTAIHLKYILRLIPLIIASLVFLFIVLAILVPPAGH